MLGLTGRYPAVHSAVTYSPGRFHVRPRTEALLIVAAQLGKERLFSGTATRAGGSGTFTGGTCPALLDKWLECSTNSGRIGAIDVNLIGLTIQREVHRLIGITTVNIVGQFHYYRFSHGCMVAEPKELGQLRRLAPKTPNTPLGHAYLANSIGAGPIRSVPHNPVACVFGPCHAKSAVRRHRSSCGHTSPRLCVVLGVPDSTLFPPPSNLGAPGRAGTDSAPERPLCRPLPPLPTKMVRWLGERTNGEVGELAPGVIKPSRWGPIGEPTAGRRPPMRRSSKR